MQFLQGFLCPLCMTNYPSAVALQHHYTQQHSNDANGDAVKGGMYCSNDTFPTFLSPHSLPQGAAWRSASREDNSSAGIVTLVR